MDSFLSRRINSIITRFVLELTENTGVEYPVYKTGAFVVSSPATVTAFCIPSPKVNDPADIAATSPTIVPSANLAIVPLSTISPLSPVILSLNPYDLI